MRSRLLLAMVLLAIAMSSTPVAMGQLYWDGGAGTPFWGDANNWIPNLVPDSDQIVRVDLANVTTRLDANYSIVQLIVENGADVINSKDDGATTSYTLMTRTNSTMLITGAGSSVTIYGQGLETTGDSVITVDDGGALNLNSQTPAGTALVKGSVANSGTVFGNGRIELQSFFSNPGTLSAGAFGGAPEPPATKLQIVGGSIGLGGAGSVVNVFANAELEIFSGLSAAFSFDLNLFRGSVLDIQNPWSMNGGTIDVTTTNFFLGTPGPEAALKGGKLSFSGGTISLGPTDILGLDAMLDATGGVINNAGTIRVRATTSVGPGVDFNMIGGEATLLINALLKIDSPDFDLDGAGGAGNLTKIFQFGNLDLTLGAAADTDFNHTIEIAGGELDVKTAANAWSLGAGGVINATAPLSFVDGETLQMLGGSINVADGADLFLNLDTQIIGPSAFNIGAGAHLDFNTANFHHALATYNGAGVLSPGNAVVNAPTAFKVAIVNLDDGNVTLNSSLTINSDAIDNTNDGFNSKIMQFNEGGLLTVNLTNGGSWALEQDGVININDDNVDLDVYLAGADVDIRGTVNLHGAAQFDARLSSLTGFVAINSASFLDLNGGNASTNPNRITGGSIGGFGILFIPGGRALYGHGTVNARIESFGEVRAENGILTLASPTFITNTLGTASGSGTLDVVHPWNTNQTTTVDLRGGVLGGAVITNGGAGGINGFGLVFSQIVNNTHIDAKTSGTLVLSNPDNDWDGAGAGELKALSANLELRDNAAFPFTGTVRVEAGRTVFANGFELEFEPGSLLRLIGGTYRSTHGTRFGGTTTVFAGSPSTIQTDGMGGFNVFESGSITVLDADLVLNGLMTINVNADFTGAGNLVVNAGTLRLSNGVNSGDLGVGIENRQTLDLGSAPVAAGQASAVDYLQTSMGFLQVDLGGIAAGASDRLDLTGTAALGGTLNLSLINGYVPSLGQMIQILSAAGGVSGAFSTFNQPGSMPAGLGFAVMYSATSVNLQVVSTTGFSADFDDDGDVDGADLIRWRNSFHVNNNADADNDGDSDGADFLTWQRQLGSGLAAPAEASIPEPTSLVLAALGLGLFATLRTRRK